MSDVWEIHGSEFANCNCDWGCPCQFGAKSTHGSCEAMVSGHIDTGHFNDTQLDGLNWVVLYQWPGEIAEGNGKMQALIDERADDDQREGLRKILHGESTEPGSTHFFVYHSTMSEVMDPVKTSVDVSIDVDERTATVSVPGLVEAQGTPIIDAFSGEPSRSRIHLPNGFEYTYAEMGSGKATVTAGITLNFDQTYGQFNSLDMNQDGVIR